MLLGSGHGKDKSKLLFTDEELGMEPESLPWMFLSQPSQRYVHFSSLLDSEEASTLYSSLVTSSRWQHHPEDGRDAWAIIYGKSYQKGGGARPGEIPTIPQGWRNLADRVEKRILHPVNYIQCHKYGPTCFVRPHRDPGGTVVPMLTVGQERTFRIGGTIDNENNTPQKERQLSWHHFEIGKHIKHGDLLLFSGPIAHSMVPACDDKSFNPNSCDYRISLLFRYTTDAMRKYGPGKKANEAGHKEQYQKALERFREASQ